jgi:hypothetical protein
VTKKCQHIEPGSVKVTEHVDTKDADYDNELGQGAFEATGRRQGDQIGRISPIWRFFYLSSF